MGFKPETEMKLRLSIQSLLLISLLLVGAAAQQLTVREIMAEPSIAGMRVEGEKLSPDGSKVVFLECRRQDAA